MSQLNFAEKTTVELKAIAYDVMASVQQYQQVLQAINQELSNRANAEAMQNARENVKAVQETSKPEVEKPSE